MTKCGICKKEYTVCEQIHVYYNFNFCSSSCYKETYMFALKYKSKYKSNLKLETIYE